MWKVEYNNDVGPSDEGFWEWWEVTDGYVTFRADDEDQANCLCAILNGAAISWEQFRVKG